jgi:hypothetical protein
MKSNRSSSLFLVLLLAACGGTPATPDSGGGNDAASPTDGGTDAASAPDTGGAPVDAATTVDAASDIDAFVDCSPRTFLVSTPGFAYTFDGDAINPTLHLCAGVTYTFDTMDVDSSHPMQLTQGATMLLAIPAGAITTYTVPSSGPQPDAYSCVPHGFGGDIIVP